MIRTTGGAFARTSHGGHLLITNGVVDTSGNSQFLNAHGVGGMLTVQDKGVLDTKVLRVSQSYDAPEQSVINLNAGGTIKLESFTLDYNKTPTGVINFNGGTIVPKLNEASMITRGSAWDGIQVNILEGGLVVNNSSNRIYISKDLLGSPGDGGVTKHANGDLHLYGTNTFTGGAKLYQSALVTTHDRALGAVPETPEINVSFLSNSWFGAHADHSIHKNRQFYIAPKVIASFNAVDYKLVIHGEIISADTNSVFYGNTYGNGDQWTTRHHQLQRDFERNRGDADAGVPHGTG